MTPDAQGCRKEIWQQCPCHPRGVRQRISTGVLQRVREAGNETRIVRRFAREIGVSLPVDKQDSLRRPSSALRLDPAASLAWGQRAGPQANLLRAQGRVGHFKNDVQMFLSA